jgi:hypothetical protein
MRDSKLAIVLSGIATLTAHGVFYEANWYAVSGMMHLEIVGFRKIFAVPIAGATFEESAAQLLRIFADNRAAG